MLTKLPLIPQDKANHYIYGLWLVLAVTPMSDPVTAMIVCGVVAGVKEFRDHVTKKGTPDMFDFLWTLAGGLTVTIARVL
jgi:hypothetical protein